MTAAPKSALRIPWFALALTAAMLAGYWPALGAFFVKDDLALILSAKGNTDIILRSWPGGFFRPAAELLFSIQYRYFGLAPLPYHLLSLGAHGLASWLIYRLCLCLTGEKSASRIAAMVFALHPFHTETVGWISGQMSLFSALCSLGALWTLTLINRRSVATAALILFTAVGLGFYEHFVVTPILWLFLYSYSPAKGRTRFAAAACLTFATLCGAYAYWRFAVLGLTGGNYTIDPSPQTALVNLAYYLYLLGGGSAIGARILHYDPGQLLSPGHLFEVVTPLLVSSLLLGGSAIACALRGSSFRNHQSKHLVLPALWLLVSLLPALILPDRPRRLGYLGVPALALCAAYAHTQIQQKIRPGSLWPKAVLACYLVLLGATLHQRNRDWQFAGAIERDIPSLVTVSGPCSQLAFDVPNLLGDALFFNSISTAKWLERETGRHYPVYAPHQLIEHPPPPTGLCRYRYADGRIEPVSADSKPFPTNLRGNNWAIPNR